MAARPTRPVSVPTAVPAHASERLSCPSEIHCRMIIPSAQLSDRVVRHSALTETHSAVWYRRICARSGNPAAVPRRTRPAGTSRQTSTFTADSEIPNSAGSRAPCTPAASITEGLKTRTDVTVVPAVRRSGHGRTWQCPGGHHDHRGTDVSVRGRIRPAAGRPDRAAPARTSAGRPG